MPDSDFDLSELTDPHIEFLILADRAEVLNGKLYMMGGSWDRLSIGDFSQPQTLSVAVGIVIPWHATNEPHRLQVFVDAADGQEVAMLARVDFTPGRPPILKAAEAQKVTFALTALLVIPGPGTYIVRAVMNDDNANQGKTFFHATLSQNQNLRPIQSS